MVILTIGFTQKPAEVFFSLLRDNGVRRLVDIRLHPDGQLSGFAKQQDLRYFLYRLVDCDYVHLPALAPTEAILSEYRRTHDWAEYARSFEALMDERGIPDMLDRPLFESSATCLLCSEASPERCHRRLVVERLSRAWPDIQIRHLT